MRCTRWGRVRTCSQQHTLNQKLILTKNPRYFNPARAGHIQTLQADIGVNAETSFLRLQKGQADLDGDFPTPIPPAEFLNVLNDPALSKRVVRSVQVATQFVSMNTRMKPFDNPLVRRAVNYAINKKTILRLVNGRGQVTDNWLPPAMPGYGKFSPYSYDPAMAKKLLAQAGYPNGLSTTFYSDNLSDDPRISQAIVAQLEAVGMHATLRVLDANTWQALVMTPGKAPMTWTAWYQDFPDPNDFYEPILSCASADTRHLQSRLLLQLEGRRACAPAQGDRRSGLAAEGISRIGPDGNGRCADRPGFQLGVLHSAVQRAAQLLSAQCVDADLRGLHEELILLPGARHAAHPATTHVGGDRGWRATSYAGCSGWWWCWRASR